VWALRLIQKTSGDEKWARKEKQITEVIQRNFWNGSHNGTPYAPNLKHQQADVPTQYWFLGFNPARIYSQFDLQANSLALALAIGSKEQEDIFHRYMTSVFNQRNGLLPSFYPAIQYDDWQMQELKNNFAYSFRNKPHEFHNGGLWPVWNGFLCAALMKNDERDFAVKISAAIQSAVSMNNDEFNECLHGIEHEPIGVPHCVWSAAGTVIAEASLQGHMLYY